MWSRSDRCGAPLTLSGKTESKKKADRLIPGMLTRGSEAARAHVHRPDHDPPALSLRKPVSTASGWALCSWTLRHADGSLPRFHPTIAPTVSLPRRYAWACEHIDCR